MKNCTKIKKFILKYIFLIIISDLEDKNAELVSEDNKITDELVNLIYIIYYLLNSYDIAFIKL